MESQYIQPKQERRQRQKIPTPYASDKFSLTGFGFGFDYLVWNLFATVSSFSELSFTAFIL